jgi:hypothetical protein
MSRVGAATLEAPAAQREAEVPHTEDESRRRFTIDAVVGLAVATVPYLWVLWDHRFDPLRTAWPNGSFSDFYDIQARALFHGHWDVPKGSLNIEAFVVGGKEYMYFGPFSSLLRMPVLAVTDSLDGQLTALSLLVAWVITGVFSSLLLWRVRLLIRGPVALGRAEAASYGVFLATVLSGSVLLYLATMPWVYHEDFAWGAALGVATLFAVLGVLERPSAGRVLAAGALALAATLARTTIGWGCVIAVLLAALWFALGRGGTENRRWWLPLVAAGLVPFAIGCAINWVKFGIPVGIDMGSQVFTHANEHRRDVLAAHGGRLWSPRIMPSTTWAYLRPDGLRVTPVFPFITLPAEPARAVHGAVLDQTYRTGSMTASMPLLFLLGIWGIVMAFRPRPAGRAALLRIPVLAAAIATTGVLVWGYIAHRYTTEFVPLLVLAGALGLVDVWRRVDGRSRRVVHGALAAVVALGVFGVIANVLIASAPTDPYAWRGSRAREYVELQESISDVTGHPLDDRVVQGSHLPRHAPADTLFALGDCDALYLSSGEVEQPWIPVENKESKFALTFHTTPPRGTFLLVTIGRDRPSNISLEGDGSGRFRLRIDDPYGYPNLFIHGPERWTRLQPQRTYRLGVAVDIALHRFSVRLDGHEVLSGVTSADEPLLTPWLRGAHSSDAPTTMALVEVPTAKPEVCQRLTDERAHRSR